MYINNFTIIDVETASRRVPSICSLGLVHVSGGRVVARHHYFIKPPGRFEYWNIRVHSIEPYHVKAAPRFKEIWPLIKDYCENSIIVAHNASFDLAQIQASLKEAGIDHPDFYYIDTVKMAGRLFPGFPKYNLAYLSLVMDAELGNHHDALSDASATGEIFTWMQGKYPLERSNISIYRSPHTSAVKSKDFGKHFSQLRLQLRDYQPGQALDNKALEGLEQWLASVEDFSGSYPASELVPRIEYLINKAYYHEGVHLILERLAMKFYHEKTRINLASSFRSAHKLMEKKDGRGLETWLEENFQLREEYLFDSLWRELWEYHHHGQGSYENLLKRLEFFINPFDGNFTKEKVKGKRGILIGKLGGRQARNFDRDIKNAQASLVDLNPRHVDFVAIVCGKKGLDYSPKVRKILKLKEEGLDVKILRIGR